HAQQGYTGVSISVGFSSNYSTFASLVLQKENVKKINLAYTLEAIRYAPDASKYDFKSGVTYLSAGVLFSSKLSSNRNFGARIFLGAMAGTNNSGFIYYPVLGTEQTFNLSPKFSFLLRERAAYIFNLPQLNWQATLQIGGRFIF
ncbi:MAG: hypothetical protein LBE82_00250, partial [Chitinophagaceae bacterium]|nr:hypothetical protein [Chitinophagaceae bacterium]